jgi:Tfp pilus assembly protein PilP
VRILSLVFCLGLLPILRAHAADASKGEESTIEDFLQSLSTVSDVVKRRDPFAELPPPFEMITTTNSSVDVDTNAPNMSAPILERYSISAYEVVAVLLGDQYPRALIGLPAEGASRKVVIVREADKLGNRKGVITKIKLEGVYVQQAQRSAHGFVDKSEVLLRVGGRAEEQKKTLTAKPAEVNNANKE